MASINPYHLTDRQYTFAVHYATSLNATQAAIAAGYSKATARQIAQSVLRHEGVRMAIRHEMRKVTRAASIEKGEVLAELKDCLKRNAKSLFDERGILITTHMLVGGLVGSGTTIHDLPDEITSAVDGIRQKVRRYVDEKGVEQIEVETELKLVSKATAIDMAMKHVGAYAPVRVEKEERLSLDWDLLRKRMHFSDSASVEQDVQDAIEAAPPAMILDQTSSANGNGSAGGNGKPPPAGP